MHKGDIMRKILILSLLMFIASKGIHAQEQENDPWAALTKDATTDLPVASGQTANDTSTPIFAMGKASGAAVLSVLTGVLMTAALRLVKDADGLSAPYSYSLLSGALLVSLYDIVKRYFGPDYGSAACWGALATTVTGGLALTAVD